MGTLVDNSYISMISPEHVGFDPIGRVPILTLGEFQQYLHAQSGMRTNVGGSIQLLELGSPSSTKPEEPKDIVNRLIPPDNPCCRIIVANTNGNFVIIERFKLEQLTSHCACCAENKHKSGFNMDDVYEYIGLLLGNNGTDPTRDAEVHAKADHFAGLVGGVANAHEDKESLGLEVALKSFRLCDLVDHLVGAKACLTGNLDRLRKGVQEVLQRGEVSSEP